MSHRKVRTRLKSDLCNQNRMAAMCWLLAFYRGGRALSCTIGLVSNRCMPKDHALAVGIPFFEPSSAFALTFLLPLPSPSIPTV